MVLMLQGKGAARAPSQEDDGQHWGACWELCVAGGARGIAWAWLDLALLGFAWLGLVWLGLASPGGRGKGLLCQGHPPPPAHLLPWHCFAPGAPQPAQHLAERPLLSRSPSPVAAPSPAPACPGLSPPPRPADPHPAVGPWHPAPRRHCGPPAAPAAAPARRVLMLSSLSLSLPAEFEAAGCGSHPVPGGRGRGCACREKRDGDAPGRYAHPAGHTTRGHEGPPRVQLQPVR